MAFARPPALPLSARSAGHNYMGWAVLNGSVLIDLKRISHTAGKRQKDRRRRPRGPEQTQANQVPYHGPYQEPIT